jgi:hypothetical protein
VSGALIVASRFACRLPGTFSQVGNFEVEGDRPTAATAARNSFDWFEFDNHCAVTAASNAARARARALPRAALGAVSAVARWPRGPSGAGYRQEAPPATSAQEMRRRKAHEGIVVRVARHLSPILRATLK